MATDEEIFREAMREFQDYDDESEDAQEKFYEYCMQKAREDSEKKKDSEFLNDQLYNGELLEQAENRIVELEKLLEEWIQAYDNYEPFPVSDACYVKTSEIVGNKNKREARQEYKSFKKKEVDE